MSQSDFDAFGEPVPAVTAPTAQGNRWLKWIGNGIFWLLVAGIVLTRAAYFEPGVFRFESVANWTHTLLAAL
jgi:hypothetical protein